MKNENKSNEISGKVRRIGGREKAEIKERSKITVFLYNVTGKGLVVTT
jgi:hypothetical protein